MFYQIHNIASSEYFKREYNENFNFPLHMHACFEIVAILDGKTDITIGGSVYSLERGEAIFIFPNKLHSFSSTESKHVLFIFSEKLVRSFAVKYKDKTPLCPKIKLDDYTLSGLQNLKEDDSQIKIKGLLYTLCAKLEEATEFSEGIAEKENLLMRIFSYVDKSYRADCSLLNAAAALGYDHAYISRYFKRLTGMSYNNYVNYCRLNNAGYMLKNTDSSILECAMESGFKSLRSFNRNFKEYFGKTPQEYRNE